MHAANLGLFPAVNADDAQSASIAQGVLCPHERHDRYIWITDLEPEIHQLLDAIYEQFGEAGLANLGALRVPATFRLSVVVPVFNERDTVEELIGRVRRVPIPKQIIIVDDGSSDGTRELLAHLPPGDDLRVMLHPRNQGKGAAVRTGLEQASGDVVLIQDADLEYDPAQYPRLLEPIIAGRADVVYGSRYLGDIEGQALRHRLANKLLTTASNLLSDLRLTDMETCYKVLRRDVLGGLRIEQNRFGIEPELTAKLARRGARIEEVPIAYRSRDKAHGKKIGLRDALEALWCIVRYSLAD